jgi:hypothetical protein
MPAPPRRIGQFSEDDARRIAAMVRRLEAASVLPGAGPPGGPRNWNPGTVPAEVTTAITQATASAYGGGQIRIKADDGTGTIIDDPAYPDPVNCSNYSLTSGTIAVGKRVMAGWRGGVFYLVVRDC